MLAPPQSASPELVPRSPYAGAVAPDPSEAVALTDFAAPTALPSVAARGIAFASILIASVCGGLVGFAITDIQCGGDCGPLAVLGGVVGALVTSIGTAIIAVLVLRAMSEWEDQASVRQR